MSSSRRLRGRRELGILRTPEQECDHVRRARAQVRSRDRASRSSAGPSRRSNSGSHRSRGAKLRPLVVVAGDDGVERERLALEIAGVAKHLVRSLERRAVRAVAARRSRLGRTSIGARDRLRAWRPAVLRSSPRASARGPGAPIRARSRRSAAHRLRRRPRHDRGRAHRLPAPRALRSSAACAAATRRSAIDSRFLASSSRNSRNRTW